MEEEFESRPETSQESKYQIKKLDDFRWLLPKTGRMRVPGLIYASEKMLEHIRKEKAIDQVANVAHLPGIVRYSFAMPDIHWGYGFAIGGVAATDVKEGGAICPGGIGFDINCGVRLIKTNLPVEDVRPKIRELVSLLFTNIPCGVGKGGDVRVSSQEEKKILVRGARWAVERGFGTERDLSCTEAGGCIEGADPDTVSDRAYERGRDQCGTLGSGNHFLEVQVVDQIFDESVAQSLGVSLGQVMVMIHCGSRGLGHQICEDYIHRFMPLLQKYNIEIPDRQLVCAPVNSEEGQAYLSAMRGAANFAWANRQILMHLTRQIFEKFFRQPWEKLGMSLIYDVAHNIAKLEKHAVEGKERLLCVHRKGATRAFPPGHPELPEEYKKIGQPVIIPGDMGRASYLLAGTEKAIEETFGTTCHGAGRLMSRGAAIRAAKGRSIRKELEGQGIIAMSRGRMGLEEEQPAAYKDIDEVVRVVHGAGLSRRILRLRPLGVIKG